MKYVIRRSVWESNSSSQHSVCVTKNDTHIDPKNLVWDCNNENQDFFDTVYLSDGVWRLRDIEDGYGRYPFQILTSFEDKFKYAMCEFLGWLYEDDPEWQRWYDEFKRIATEVIPGFKDFRIDTKDIDIYMDHDGNEILHKDLHYDHWNQEKNCPEYYYLDSDGNKCSAIFNEDEYLEMPNIGSIDHQSMGLLKNFIKDKEISLKEFLTNKKYNIVVDGDEYEDWDRLKASGIIDLDNIEEEYFGSDDQKRWEEYKKEHDLAEDFEDEASGS